METSLDQISVPAERDRFSATAWNKYSWIQLASHAAFAVPWFIGRTMLSGNEVTARARTLTVAKDVLVGASLVTGIATVAIGRLLSRRSKRGQGPERSARSSALETVVAVTGSVNALATTGVLGVTSLLAMEACGSKKFARISRRLP